jgi:hypothetical protein
VGQQRVGDRQFLTDGALGKEKQLFRQIRRSDLSGARDDLIANHCPAPTRPVTDQEPCCLARKPEGVHMDV